MKRSILSQMGFSTQEDSTLLKERLIEVLQQLSEQKQLIASLTATTDQKYNQLADNVSDVKNTQSSINTRVAALSESISAQKKSAEAMSAATRRIEERLSSLERKFSENFEVLSGFMRLMAANQLMILQEAYSLDDSSNSRPTAGINQIIQPALPKRPKIR